MVLNSDSVTLLPLNETSSFSTVGSINLGNSTDLFTKLAYSVPFGLSAVDAYITSLVSKKFITGFEPTYFQIPYIYSASDNLINGNYTSSSVTEGSKLITTYIIPYNSKPEIKTVTITTYFDETTNILFYEIPREFSYNSKDQASVAVAESGSDFVGKIYIPSSFVTLDDKPIYKIVDFNIIMNAIPSATVLTDTNPIATATVDVRLGNKFIGNNTKESLVI